MSTLSSFIAFCSCALLASPLHAMRSNLSTEEGPRFSPAEVEALELLRTLRDPEAAPPEIIAGQIQKLGEPVIECLMEALTVRRLPDPLDSSGDDQVLSEVQQAAVLATLGAHGRDVVMPYWEASFTPTPEEPLDERATAAALHALEGFAHGRDLQLVWELVGIEQAVPQELSGAVSAGLESAISSVLSRDPSAFNRLENAWSRLPEAWLDEVVRAVGGTRDARGLGLYAEMVQLTSGQQRLIASQIPLLGASSQSTVNTSLTQAMLSLLNSDSKEDRQAAVLALAFLEDFSVVPELIERLEDPRPGVPQNTHRALCILTGKTLAPNLPLWRHWYKGELSWAHRDRVAVLKRLDSRESNVVIAALREIATHRLDRHDLAVAVARVLDAQDPELRVLTTQVLADLGSRWGARALINSLTDESEAVRVAAHSALVRIAGKDCGTDYGDWAEEDWPARAF